MCGHELEASWTMMGLVDVVLGFGQHMLASR